MCLNFKGEAVQELLDPGSKRSAIEKYHTPEELDLQICSALNGGFNSVEKKKNSSALFD